MQNKEPSSFFYRVRHSSLSCGLRLPGQPYSFVFEPEKGLETLVAYTSGLPINLSNKSGVTCLMSILTSVPNCPKLP